MTKRKKNIILSIVGLFVLFIVTMTWLYPFSVFSMYKHYSFKADPVVVAEYEKDLLEFEASFEEEAEALESERNKDRTIDRTQYVLPLFEQDWLVSKEHVKMGIGDLDNMSFDVKNTRKSLMELLAEEDYSKEQRQDLITSIENLLLLEEELVEMKTEKAESRKTLNIQFSNLQVRFINNFMIFKNFYERSKNE
jgi:hypothetical protein